MMCVYTADAVQSRFCFICLSQNDQYRMHLQSSTGPINVLVLNQDEGLASLIPSSQKANQQQLLQGQPLSVEDETSHTTSTLTSCPPSTTDSANSSSLPQKATPDLSASVAGTSSEAATSRVPTSGGVVTRRMRRQAAAELGEQVERRRKREEEEEEGGGGVGTMPTVEVSIDEVEAMDTEEVYNVLYVSLWSALLLFRTPQRPFRPGQNLPMHLVNSLLIPYCCFPTH